MDPQVYLGFLFVSFALAMTPGADWAYAIAAGLGRYRVVSAVAGLCTGYVFHTILIVAGMAALIASSPQLLSWLTLAGAAYLLWLGISTARSWRGAGFTVAASPRHRRTSGSQRFRSGIRNGTRRRDRLEGSRNTPSNRRQAGRTALWPGVLPRLGNQRHKPEGAAALPCPDPPVRSTRRSPRGSGTNGDLRALPHDAFRVHLFGRRHRRTGACCVRALPRHGPSPFSAA